MFKFALFMVLCFIIIFPRLFLSTQKNSLKRQLSLSELVVIDFYLELCKIWNRFWRFKEASMRTVNVPLLQWLLKI